ncbi:MAG TPA: FmdB family zinc ribbon protein [Jatrophihabitans sp.]|jgi:putative FmdB family regulatory protein|uniref:FmdB family zinc ribbon protein n=1 Tax=Jatrophihabitans sp. TaxID=1932789 RepID=UPI002EF3998E
MPTYQYACTSDQCGLRFERVQAFTDPAVSECPDCNERVRKVYGSVGVVFKGSGFYRTDSRDAKAGANGKSDAAAGKDGTNADAGKGSEAAKGDAGSATKSADSTSSGTATSKGESSKSAAAVAS